MTSLLTVTSLLCDPYDVISDPVTSLLPCDVFSDRVPSPLAEMPDYWISGAAPACPRIDCGEPPKTPGGAYGTYADTKYQSSFYFGCEDTFSLAGQST